MKVLFFTRYTRTGASSRLRSFQYFPFLRDAGVMLKVDPLFSDLYLDRKYKGKSTTIPAITSYVKRFFKLFTLWKYDKIFIEKELFPYLPALVEKLISFLGIRYIVDYDDAIFHNYDLHPNPVVRFFLGKKIDVVMKNAETVTAGNNYLADRARNAGANKVEVIPTVIDIKRYKCACRKENSHIVIGWIGSPSTFKYVQGIKEVLQEVVDLYDVEIHIIGAKGDLGFSKNVKFLEWREETEVAKITNFDIGIMPLKESPWENGKCAYKLIQYMGCGIPVVASAVGMNNEVVVNGESGYLVRSEDEWKEALEKYILDKPLRIKHGLLGLQTIKDTFSLQITASKMLNIIKK